MRFWLNILVVLLIALIILLFIDTYTGGSVFNVKKDIREVRASYCKNSDWCLPSAYTSGYFCKDGSIFRNQSSYFCNVTTRLCELRRDVLMMDHCNPDTYCVDGISNCQPKELKWCIDSDNGNNKYNVGKAIDADGKEIKDFCITDKKLIEVYCGEDGEIVTEEIECFCKEGRC